MAYGLPVVATATHGARDLLDPATTGVLVPLDRPDALAAAIDTLLGDERLRRQMGERAKVSAKALDAPVVAQQYAAAIASVL